MHKWVVDLWEVLSYIWPFLALLSAAFLFYWIASSFGLSPRPF